MSIICNEQRGMHKLTIAAALICGSGLLLATQALAADSYDQLSDFVSYLKQDGTRQRLNFAGTEGVAPYGLTVHATEMVPLLKNSYTTEEIAAINAATAKARTIAVLDKPWGTFVQAASFESEEMGSSTNYDAVWVRDSVWAYLALNAAPQTRPQAKRILLTLLDYMATPAQIARMKDVIGHPALLDGADGQMRAVHIRFNADSPVFADVFVAGKPQSWNHKQNDALGLMIDAVVTAVNDGQITLQDLQAKGRLQALVYLVGYLDAAKFYQMEDSGAWEENARLNTSSVALVTSALENLQQTLKASNQQAEGFAAAFLAQAQTLGLAQTVSAGHLQELVNKGYQLIDTQLSEGGESPAYAKSDAHYRTADAALLNLIYPARLSRLSVEQKRQVLEMVRPLVGDFGIRRYANDDYQSANFWFKNVKTDVDEKSFNARKKRFVPGSEAQWFFSSWYAKDWLMLYRETHNPVYLGEAVRFTNQSLSQLTGKGALGANGQVVSSFALPESYNLIADQGQLWEVPSPIVPLNWSKASMTLMFDEYASLK